MSSRRSFIKKSAAGLASLSALPTIASANTPVSQNLIILYIDDLNDHVGFMDGYANTHTPHMNSLAEQGTAFLNAHATVPVCNPSRVSTLFGADPTNSDVYTNSVHYWDSPYLANKKSIFKHLKDNGHQVYGGGKLFHSSWEPHNDVNWDEYYTSPQRLHANMARSPSGANLDVSGVTNSINTIFPTDFGAYGSDSDYSDFDVATWADQKIRSAPDGFVLGVGFEKPHFPYVVPQKYFDLYNRNQLMVPSWRAQRDIEDLPDSTQYLLENTLWSEVIPFLNRENKMRDHIHAYLAAISFVDDMVGMVVDAWETRKANTSIILVSDHGQFLGEKMQVGKHFLWDRATRVPCVMAGPGIIKNRHTTPFSLLNIYPTACRLLGAPEPAHLDGIAVNNSLTTHNAWLQNARSYYRYPIAPHEGYIVKSIRHDRFRITQWPDGYEFYDYVDDPKEVTNLWPECDSWGIFQQFKALL